MASTSPRLVTEFRPDVLFFFQMNRQFEMNESLSESKSRESIIYEPIILMAGEIPRVKFGMRAASLLFLSLLALSLASFIRCLLASEILISFCFLLSALPLPGRLVVDDSCDCGWWCEYGGCRETDFSRVSLSLPFDTVVIRRSRRTRKESKK